MTTSRIAPYKHVDGSPCWTKNCKRNATKNSGGVVNSIKNLLGKAKEKTGETASQESIPFSKFITYEQGVLDKEQIVAATDRKIYVKNGKGGYIVQNLRNTTDQLKDLPTISDFQKSINTDLKYPYYVRVGDSVYLDKESALAAGANLGEPSVRRALGLQPLSENIIPNKVKPLYRKLEKAWVADTSAYEEWSYDIPEAGQCAVTALLVQEQYGGELNRALVNGVSHYWNTLPDGTEVDLTRRQFEEPLEIVDPIKRDRDYVLSHEVTAKRYAILKERLGELS